MIAAIYARVSTFEQEPENQLGDLRRYASARGWTCKEFVDRGISGAKDRRPSLDLLVRDAKRRRFKSENDDAVTLEIARLRGKVDPAKDQRKSDGRGQQTSP